jgi:hypothetical protein
MSPPHLRDSAFWRKQEGMLLDAFKQAFESPLVNRCYLATIATMRETRTRQTHSRQDVEAAIVVMEEALTHTGLSLLARALCAASPGLVYALGPHLQRWLMALLAVDAFDDPYPTSWQQKQWHLLPGNPVTIGPHQVVHGLLAASPAQQRQFGEYLESFHALKPGRRKNRETKEELLAEVRPIIHQLRHTGLYASQERVADILYPKDADGARKLRRRAKKHGMSWDDILASAY